jgi:hypothetical protein
MKLKKSISIQHIAALSDAKLSKRLDLTGGSISNYNYYLVAAIISSWKK